MRTGSHQISTLHSSAIKTLLYFDIFNYPLKAEEVYQFLGTNSVTSQDVNKALKDLADRQKIYRIDDFYAVHDNAKNIHRRLKGNAYAEKLKRLVYKRAALLANFPFVRGVFASGSYSKNYMDENSDLDFFIVTAPGRLWIARTLIVLFKRIFFLNSHKYFCCNYFIDTDNLEIEEKNIFTATELATLTPLFGGKLYNRIILANQWLINVFPNFKPKSTDHVIQQSPGVIKRLLEKLLVSKAGDLLDNFFMTTTLKRWQRHYATKYSTEEFSIAFKTRKHVSKNHPKHYQEVVSRSYQEKLNWYSEQNKIQLN
jgi:hypothetical protein